MTEDELESNNFAPVGNQFAQREISPPSELPAYLLSLISAGATEKELLEIDHRTARIKLTCEKTNLPEMPLAHLAPDAIEVIAAKLGHGGHVCATVIEDGQPVLNFAFVLETEPDAPAEPEQPTETQLLAMQIVELQQQNAALMARLDKPAAPTGKDSFEELKNLAFEKMMQRALKDPTEQMAETLDMLKKGAEIHAQMRDVAKEFSPPAVTATITEPPQPSGLETIIDTITDPEFANSPIVRGVAKRIGFPIGEVDSEYLDIEAQVNPAEAG